MIMSSTEFFRNLPLKECAKCGKVVKEIHEYYSNKCPDCEEKIK